MKKLLIILSFVLMLAAVGPGQAQAATCTCELTYLDKIIGFIGIPVACGKGSIGAEKGDKKENLSDLQVATLYLNQNQNALNSYYAGQFGYDWLISGWSCLK